MKLQILLLSTVYFSKALNRIVPQSTKDHPEMLPDRVHPNTAGATLMARAVFKALTGKEFQGQLGHSAIIAFWMDKLGFPLVDCANFGRNNGMLGGCNAAFTGG